MHEQIYDMLMQKDEITWQNIIQGLVKSEEMDPWDVDVSLLSRKYLETIKKLKETNFLISGKMVLASAILLKIKSEKLVSHNIAAFDNLLFSNEEELEEVEEYLDDERPIDEIPQLVLKTPQPRKRKVSLNDLVGALHKALDFDERKKLKKDDEIVLEKPTIPEKKIDITILIKNLYDKIKDFFMRSEKLTFNKLVPSERREDKILTFVPLLHLSNQNKVDLDQKEAFGDIDIKLMRKGYY
jgi:segregation and condensation protein A